ncbi:pentapeptide repeat-containing protein [Aestuariimicrobium sp. T2.26MG-19.2B]|uniref:pentapeptide repeat-containing protein n=1 Tax=Aestuariimicrobium sp. T2.26MG-19.2B TaxID=3040679 RepID=UPI0024776D26|nr:pentapeptide repeat-containing protein [Aestuariimicrobium sp. T2.26MG-19.2B]CAI9411659.1 hypothetical protein AESSP_02695 [Aestuariimicrobium sp. T2.26MG-19.2B]
MVVFAVILLALIATVWTMGWLLIGRPWWFRAAQPVDADSQVMLDITRIAVTVLGVIGVGIGSYIGYRRQLLGEHAHQQERRRDQAAAARDAALVERDRRDYRRAVILDLRDRYITAAQQLGDPALSVRLAGTYSMAGVADSWLTLGDESGVDHDGRRREAQACLDVLSAYIRSDQPNPTRDATDDSTTAPWDVEIRQTIIAITTQHLQDGAPTPWHGLALNYTGARFHGSFRFQGAAFSAGEVSFVGATFSGGEVFFVGATFSGGRVIFDGATFSGGRVIFGGATFSGGEVSFVGATFSGGQVSFDGATFSGGQVSFDGATFSGGRVAFGEAEFSGGQVIFDGATFSSGWVSLVGATFSGGRVAFGGATFSGGLVSFFRATFSGGQVSFDEAEFSGGQVSFDEAEFSGGQVSFDEAEFSGGSVIFDGATFSGGSVIFDGATFSSGWVIFDGATFSGGEVFFVGATFSGGEVSFNGSHLRRRWPGLESGEPAMGCSPMVINLWGATPLQSVPGFLVEAAKDLDPPTPWPNP